jgi:chromate transporter
VRWALIAAAVAFAPSFAFVLAGARRFDALRSNRTVLAFLNGAGPAAIGGIAGSVVVLGQELVEPWQFVVFGLSVAGMWIVPRRRASVVVLGLAAVTGVLVGLLGAPVPH